MFMKKEDLNNLIEKYNSGYQHANESELRKDILDEFLKLLDWDLNNIQSLPFYQREVIVEENLKGKFPDYSFRNTSKGLVGDPSLYFFVEAKDAKQDLYKHLFQAMSYGYSGTTRGGYPLVVLFNFEKLLILNCTQKPDLSHSKEFLIKNKILKEWSKDEYEENWEEIFDILSKKAVQNGSLGRLLEEKVAGDRFVSLDQDFLADFWQWHHKLTEDIINSNQNLQFKRNNSKTATETATRILNRLVFLKVCEDRETENGGEMYKNLVDKSFEQGDESWLYKKNEEGTLFDKTKGEIKKPYQEFLKLCEIFHTKYNSDLFDIDKDKHQEIVIGVEQVQSFSYYGLNIKNDIFQEIVTGLQFSPYIFSIIPVEVLGYIYEQFLAYKQKYDYETGKTIVEQDKKKKTNKDEGIYYTPKEIVSFIIQATVDNEKLKTNSEKSWLDKTAVDPACGSGTFLIGWYEFLYNKYLEYYSQNSGHWIEKGVLRNAGNGKYTLTLEAKKKIIVDQVFGVDMDREAVEIAKLSLCLKVLEGENNGTIDEEKLKHGEPALPTLSKNIKSGNSLMDSKQGGDVFFAETEKEYKLKPFVWSEEFKLVFENQGFDYVFANPPYISMKKFPKDQVSTIYKDFILKNYTTFTKKSDIYCCFFELALRKENGILKHGGRLGFITSSTYFAESSFAQSRKLFFENNLLYYSIPRPDIFRPRASVNASVIGVQKNNQEIPLLRGGNEVDGVFSVNQKLVDIYAGDRIKNEKNEMVLEYKKVSKVDKKLIQKFDVLLTKVNQETVDILNKVSSFVPFSEVCETQYGCATGDNDVWLRDKTKSITRKQWLDKNIKIFGTTRNKDGEEEVDTNLKEYYKGEHISRYYLHKTQYEVNYLPERMKKHRTTARPGDIDDRFEKIKIVISDIGSELNAFLDIKGKYFDLAPFVFIKKEEQENYLYAYILGILNSKVINIFFGLTRSNLHFQINKIKKLTIPPAPLETQREIAEWVRRLTDLYEIYYTQKDTWTDSKMKEEEARLVRVEYEIDKRVCELYGVVYEDLV